MTNDLIKHIYEHKNKVVKDFTRRYNINRLVYYEAFESVGKAI